MESESANFPSELSERIYNGTVEFSMNESARIKPS